MSEKSEKLEAWKTFLQGRIAQEQGNSESALDLFNSALEIEPDNKFFHRAKSFALAQLNMPEEAIISQISSGYAELASKYVGKEDKPQAWIGGLKKLLEKAKSPEQERLLTEMAW